MSHKRSASMAKADSLVSSSGSEGGSPHWHVIKRDGTEAPFDYSKVLARLRKLAVERPPLHNVNVDAMVQHVFSEMKNGVETRWLDEAAQRYCEPRAKDHHEYEQMAVRILESSIRKDSPATIKKMTGDILAVPYKQAPQFLYTLSDTDFVLWMEENADELQAYIDQQGRDKRKWRYTYMGMKILSEKYLQKQHVKKMPFLENIDFFWMRVAAALWWPDMEMVKKEYDSLSSGRGIYATPTIARAGKENANLSSCFLQCFPEDSIESIASTWWRTSTQSKGGGGVGIGIGNLRAAGATIAGTDGVATGLTKLAQVMEKIAEYVDQGGNKRAGTVSINLPAWHPQSLEFIRMGSHEVDPKKKTEKLNFCWWAPSIFFKRMKEGKDWSFMEPNSVAKTLEDIHFNQFLQLSNRASVSNAVHGMYRCMGGGPVHFEYFYGEEFDALYEALEEFEGVQPGHVKITTVPMAKLLDDLRSLTIQIGRVYFQLKDEHTLRSPLQNWGPAFPGTNICTEMSMPSGRLPARWKKKVIEEMVRLYKKPYIGEGERQKNMMTLLCRDTEGCHSVELHNMLQKNPEAFIEMTVEKSPVVTAVCNLASIIVSEFVYPVIQSPNETPQVHPLLRKQHISWTSLAEEVELKVRGLAQVLYRTHCPDLSSFMGNLLFSSVGLGIAGLHDFFIKLGVPFCSEEAARLDALLFEHIYYHAMRTSIQLALEHKRTYPMFEDSPLQKGKFIFDLYPEGDVELSGEYDWEELRQLLRKHGSFLSNVTTVMPTDSTAKINGISAMTQPHQHVASKKSLNIGSFVVVNSHFQRQMEARGLWGKKHREELLEAIKNNRGVVTGLPERLIPLEQQELWRGVYQMKQSTLLKMAAGRKGFLTHAQSLNVHWEKPTNAGMNGLWMMTYDLRISGVYYTLHKTVGSGEAFGEVKEKEPPSSPAPVACPEDCDYCGI